MDLYANGWLCAVLPKKKGAKNRMRIIFWVVGILVGVLVAEILLERKLLLTRKEEIPLPELPVAFDGLRILQISDLHHRTFGKNQRRILKRAKRLQPDLIVITGDLVSRDQRNFTKAGNFCKLLAEISSTYFAIGNHEGDLPPKVLETYLKTLERAGVVVLQNRTHMLRRGNARLALTGIALPQNVYKDENSGYKNLNSFSVENMRKLVGVRKSCTILLAHNPLLLSVYAAWTADLVLSGHVHGGMIRLPILGGLLSPERKFLPLYTKGLYQCQNTSLYVSAGLGKLRLFNPPELNLLTLRCLS
jgi:predicted MPP superfamily phosphohydrolase